MVLEKKQIMILIVAAIGFGSFILFRYIPVSKKLEEVENKRKEQNLIIAKGHSDKEQISLFEEHLQKLRERLDKFEANIPQKKDIGSFLIEIADLMEDTNLKDQAIQPLEEVKANELICIPVNMEGRGSLSEIFEFYEKLQDLDRQIRIKQVKLKNGNDFNGDISMKTEIVIYYRNQVG